MSTFTPSTTQQLVLDGAARRATEAAQAAFAHGRQQPLHHPDGLGLGPGRGLHQAPPGTFRYLYDVAV
jgi:hypothetical protein